ncbi:chromate resistance protein ChrB domain-containing protein [Desulfonatronum thioautotrophicum]|uniref:chromate resistance protein ChrB domain-containing protein n=1 Tax=Desulfonatronum thioautotrophicum TaxID=617001 RepID=UPI000699F195|nr:chromate resistance protein ChrB domain-containing protein [Desulfonatronum thioautotrophicum]
MKTNDNPPGAWLLCIHNIPPKPAYLRAKAARRLSTLGAVALKNAVYVLPDGDRQRDGLLWLSKEIEEGGGRAFVCLAGFDVAIGGMDDGRIKALFVEARDAQYRELAAEIQPLFEALGEPHEADEARRGETAAWLAQVRSRFEAIVAVDFFGAPGREVVEGILAGTEKWLRLAAAGEEEGPETDTALRPEDYQGRTWVTRPGVHVDRIASAWLIRRFIDPEAGFRFDAKTVSPRDVRFDMAEAEFTHEGAECTFEVMLRRFGLLDDPALKSMGVIIHDIDLEELHPARPESPGIAALLTGIALRTNDDQERLNQGFQVLDSLLQFFRETSKGRQAGQR